MKSGKQVVRLEAFSNRGSHGAHLQSYGPNRALECEEDQMHELRSEVDLVSLTMVPVKTAPVRE